MQTIIKQNLGWALVYNVIALPLAAAGWVAPWMAAIGMSTSSLIVVINALRLNRIGQDKLTNGKADCDALDDAGVSQDRQVV